MALAAAITTVGLLAGGTAVAAEAAPTYGQFVNAFNPPHNGCYFWSGKNVNGGSMKDDAAKRSRKQNGYTLEMMLTKTGLMGRMPKWGEPGSVKVWTEASLAFARSCRGNAYVFLGLDRRPGNAWDKTEFPALKKWGKVNSIWKVNINNYNRQGELIYKGSQGGRRVNS
jgi:hypothetical protein